MTVTDNDALVGTVLDQRYVVHERIARGGMATVYRATDKRLDRVVAIKVMHPNLGDPQEFRDRFEREAKAAARLHHPNVVAVFDQGEDGDVTYLVMEYVPGRTLRDVMRAEAPMAPERALTILMPVLTALSAAHNAGIVHRDVKPENVLISAEGAVKVTDFGLARAVSTATQTGNALIGTVSYIAPEVVEHSGSDERTDVYSCGAMLFEMLTGTKPHVADTPIQVAYLHVHEDIPAPSTLRSDLTAPVDALVVDSTARDRELRTPDTRTMLEQLRAVLASLGASTDWQPTVDLGTSARTAADFEATRAVLAPAIGADALTTQVSEATRLVADGSGPAPQQPTDKRRRRGWLILGLAIAAFIAMASLGWWFAVGRYDPAPNLVGMTQQEATAAATKAGYKVDVGSPEFSETVPSGVVISAKPGKGQRILPGATITIVPSKGKERYAIPDLAGVPVDQAIQRLKALHLKVGNQTQQFDLKIPAGSVIGTSNIAAGQQVPRDTSVDLVVSKGREPVTIADYTGQPGDAAVAALQKAGLTVNRIDDFNDTVPSGIVISQDPGAGQAFKGDTVNLHVSKGPQMVAVPSLIGMARADALAAIQAAGLQASPSGVGGDKATVRAQSPSAGTQVPPGSTVSFFVTP